LVSLEIHGSKIYFDRNIFLSFYRNIVSRVNNALSWFLKTKSDPPKWGIGAQKAKAS
jgi:hypothetical protein